MTKSRKKMMQREINLQLGEYERDNWMPPVLWTVEFLGLGKEKVSKELQHLETFWTDFLSHLEEDVYGVETRETRIVAIPDKRI